MRRRLAVLPVAALLTLIPLTVQAATPPAPVPDRLRAVDVNPPGESGLDTLAGFATGTSGLTPTYGANTANQMSLYADWKYKSDQFAGQGQGTAPPGDPNVRIWRDPHYGVPTITAPDERDAFYGVGYAMASDRLFQMEVFRRVGHGTLAQLIGPAGLPMDEAVRAVTVGNAALQAQFDALPAGEKATLTAFTAGVNAEIQQVQDDPSTIPAEFALLGDWPIAPWTVLDSVAFGQYAGKFFGEFDSSALLDARLFLHLVQTRGEAAAQRIYRDLVPLDDPHAPTTIPAADGTFPRHTGSPVASADPLAAYANRSPAALPPAVQLDPVAAEVSARAALIKRLQQALALPKWGSNAVLVAPSRSADHAAMLYGGPQTGWAVPGFLWEVEIHDPVRNERGFMVPGIPLMVIGRNPSAAWTVTSAEDQNADVYVLQLDPSNTFYVHDGHRLAVVKKTETIPCTNPPTDATDLVTSLAGGAPAVPSLCPEPATTITVYRTVEGEAVAPPDAGHHLYVQRSAVDGRLLSSFFAWDRAGRQTTVGAFGSAVAGVALGFNFFYADTHGDIGYWHAGRYPIRPANADPSLPMPGNGSYDWQGFEPFSAQPHVVDPPQGWLANWNNKPAVGWWSPPLGEANPFTWGDGDQVQALQSDVAGLTRLTFARFGQVPRDVAYVDERAVLLKPYLLAALAHSADPQLRQIRADLAAWDDQRSDLNPAGTGYATPAVAFFDRWYAEVLDVVERPVLGSAGFALFSGLACPGAGCVYHSNDNESALTYKFESSAGQTLLAALRGQAGYPWLGSQPWQPLLSAAQDTAAFFDATQGSDVAAWNESPDAAVFSPQGAISVPNLLPLPDRGSIGQVVEATG